MSVAQALADRRLSQFGTTIFTTMSGAGPGSRGPYTEGGGGGGAGR